jgi:hypothetical protein
MFPKPESHGKPGVQEKDLPKAICPVSGGNTRNKEEGSKKRHKPRSKGNSLLYGF